MIFKESWHFMVTLDDKFLDTYLTKINPMFICIYIYMQKNVNSSAKDIAEAFKLLESDVVKIIDFWNNEKMLEKPSVSQINVPPTYSPKELEIYQKSHKEVKELFKLVEKSMGRFFDAKHLSTIYSFYDFYRLPFPVITYLLEYCESIGQNRINYMEKVAIDWAENGIDTVERAKTHTSMFNKDYRSVMKALGLSRNSAPVEEAFINKWIDDYKMPMNIILEACDTAILGAMHKPTFSYIDGIITKWHNHGVKTIDDVKKYKQEFKDSQDIKPPTSTKKPKKSKFENYTSEKKDYNKIFEDIERLKNEEFKKTLEGK